MGISIGKNNGTHKSVGISHRKYSKKDEALPIPAISSQTGRRLDPVFTLKAELFPDGG